MDLDALAAKNLFKRFNEAKLVIPGIVAAQLEYFGEVAGNNEYAMFYHSDIDWDTMTATIDGEFNFVPEQEVNPVHYVTNEHPDIDDAYKPLPERFWNTIVHRHPSGCSRFSGEDESSTNHKAMISFLYHRGFNFPYAIWNIPISCGDSKHLFYVPCKIIVEDIKTEIRQEKRTAYERSFSTFDEEEEPIGFFGRFLGVNRRKKHQKRLSTRPVEKIVNVTYRTVDGYEDFKACFDEDPKFNKVYLASKLKTASYYGRKVNILSEEDEISSVDEERYDPTVFDAYGNRVPFSSFWDE